MRRRAALLLIILCACRRAPLPSHRPPAEALVLTRGALQDRLLLTGELEAVSSVDLVTPRTSQWQINLRYLAPEGSAVKAGERVAEFDNSSFVTARSDKQLAAQTARSELLQQRAQGEIAIADKAFEVARAKSALDKAQRRAQVPADLLPGRTYQENQLELERARVALQKAEGALEAERRSAALDLRIKEIAIQQTERQIQTAQEAIDSLVLRAPRDGLMVAVEHPWEGRKIEAGDNVFVGLAVARLPDLSRMRVRAQLSDVDEGRVASGMKATCTLDAYPADPLPCQVEEVSQVAREPSRRSLRRTFPVLLSLDRSDPARLRPGLSVKVTLSGQAVQEALLAPRAALLLQPPRLCLRDGGAAPVVVGVCDRHRCQVVPPPGEGRVVAGRLLRAAGEGC